MCGRMPWCPCIADVAAVTWPVGDMVGMRRRGKEATVPVNSAVSRAKKTHLKSLHRPALLVRKQSEHRCSSPKASSAAGSGLLPVAPTHHRQDILDHTTDAPSLQSCPRKNTSNLLLFPTARREEVRLGFQLQCNCLWMPSTLQQRYTVALGMPRWITLQQ